MPTFEKKVGLAPHHYIEIDNSSSFEGLSQQEQRILLLFFAATQVTRPEKEKATTVLEEEKKLPFPVDTILSISEMPGYELPTEISEALAQVKTCAPGIECNVIKLSDKSDLSTAIPEISYSHIVLLNEGFDLGKIKTFMSKRWDSELQLDGHVFMAKHGTIEALTKFAIEENNPHLTIIPLKSSEDSPAIWASSFAAINAANAHTPSRPYQNLEVTGLTTKTSYTLEERNNLLQGGVSTWRTQGSAVIIDRLVTTYTKSKAGADDPSYRDLNTLQTLSYLRLDLREGLQRDFPRHMLARDDYHYESLVVTPKVLKMWIVARYRKWQSYSLVQDPDNLFSKSLQVEASIQQPGKVDVQMHPHLMGQYLQTQIKMAFKI